MTRALCSLTALLLVLLIAGCGQSGPLYIPGNPSTVETPTEETDSEEEEDENGAARP